MSFSQSLTHKQLEMHGCIISIVAAVVLVMKHRAISSYSAYSLLIHNGGPFSCKKVYIHY